MIEINGIQPQNSKTVIDYLIGAGPTIVGILAVIFSYLMNRRLIKANEKLKNSEIEKEYKQKIQYFDRSEVYKRLNDFYAPLQLLRRTSAELHKIFKDGKEFRTLPTLIGGTKFDKNDKAILEEIIRIGDDCKKIIIENSGLIDNQELRDIHLPKLLTHYILIKKAFSGDISDQIKRFDGYEFPNEIDKILEDKVNKLYSQLNRLNTID